MLKRIWSFTKSILIGLLTSGLMMALSLGFMTELAVRCDLQPDQFYTCNARDTMFGTTLAQVNAEQVYEVDYDLKCSGSGSNRGCSARAEFKTAGGDNIVMSRMFTDSNQVSKAVQALKAPMAEKASVIDMTFTRPPFLMIIMISAASCVMIIFLFTAFASLFSKRPGEYQPLVIDLRKKN